MHSWPTSRALRNAYTSVIASRKQTKTIHQCLPRWLKKSNSLEEGSHEQSIQAFQLGVQDKHLRHKLARSKIRSMSEPMDIANDYAISEEAMQAGQKGAGRKGTFDKSKDMAESSKLRDDSGAHGATGTASASMMSWVPTSSPWSSTTLCAKEAASSSSNSTHGNRRAKPGGKPMRKSWMAHVATTITWQLDDAQEPGVRLQRQTGS